MTTRFRHGLLPVLAILAVPAAASAASPGALDTSFSGDGLAGLNPPTRLLGVAVAPAGRIYATGEVAGASPRVLLTRFSTSGTQDGGFPRQGPSAIVGTGRSIALQADGKVVVAGTAEGAGAGGMLVERFTAEGAPDTSFGGDGAADIQFANAVGEGNAVTIQRDGKIVVAGSAVGADGYSRVALARFNPDGTRDASFGFGGVSVGQLTPSTECTVPGRLVDCLRQSVGQGVAVGTDGKIVVAGFSQFNLQSRDGVVVRFNANGTLDGSFAGDGVARVGAGTFGGAGVEFRALVLGAGNRPTVTGTATPSPNAANISAITPIIRFTTGGGLDGSFSGDGIVTFPAARSAVSSDTARAGASGLALAKDGRVVAGGSFFDSGVNELAVWAVNAGGAVENGFGAQGAAITRLPGTLIGVGNAVAVGVDGNPVLAGEASAIIKPDQPAGALARYGGFGPLFVPPTPFNPRKPNIKVTIPGKRIVISTRARGTFRIASSNQVPVRVSVRVVSSKKIKASKRARARTVTFATTTVNLRAKQSGTATLKLSKGNLALLRRLKRIGVKISLTVRGSNKTAKLKPINSRLDAPKKRR